MDFLYELFVRVLRLAITGVRRSPQTTSFSETALLPPPSFAVVAPSNAVKVWQAEVKASVRDATLHLIVRYPRGIRRDSVELPGYDGDKPFMTCQVGGVPVQVLRCLRGATHLGIVATLPVGADLSDLFGQTVSLVWGGAQFGVYHSIAFRIGQKKV